MKKFIKKAIIFGIVILCITLIADISISYYSRSNDYVYAWNEIYQNKVNSNFIVFGSSRAQNNFDPQIIGDSLHIKAYNMGLCAAQIEMAYLRLLELLKYNTIKPKYISLEVGYSTLYENVIFSNHHQLFPYMLFNKNCYECTKHIDAFKEYNFYIPIIRYANYFNKSIESCMPKKSIDNKKLGYIYLPDSTFDTTQIMKQIREKYEKAFPIGKIRIEFLNKFVQLCQENDIKLNFVYAPEFYPGRCFFKNRDEVLSFFHNYADSLGIPFADFSNDVEFNSDTSNFFNVQHLCKKGAEKFTSEMYVPWIKELYGL